MPYANPEDKKARDAKRAEWAREQRRINPEFHQKEREARNKWYNERYRNDPEFRAQKNRKRVTMRYGITVEDYDRMLVVQGGKCALCFAEPVDEPGKRLHVDHCHDTGKVRGLLCVACNTGMGKLRDNVEVLKRAIEYLEKNRES